MYVNVFFIYICEHLDSGMTYIMRAIHVICHQYLRNQMYYQNTFNVFCSSKISPATGTRKAENRSYYYNALSLMGSTMVF